MSDFGLTDAELRFLAELQRCGLRFMLVGMGAALLQGARGATEDLDLWFENVTDPRIAEAAKVVGGFYVSGNFGMRPPALGGDTLGDRFDVVTHMHGLQAFDAEYALSGEVELQGLALRTLTLERIRESKLATGRPKDQAQIPALDVAIEVRRRQSGSR